VPFPLLSDFNKEVTTRYGVLEEDYFGLKGVAKRAVFVIGRDGKVAYDWVSDDSGVEPNYG
jgi:peroxiredoxin